MLKLHILYLKYFFYLTKNFHIFWKFYNINHIDWNIKKNYNHITLIYKPNIWIWHYTAELEAHVLVYYFLILINKNIPLTIYNVNFNIFFKNNFFSIIFNFYYNYIFKNIKTYLRIILFNVKWILISFLISFIYFFFIILLTSRIY